jgi:uncharacterized protein YdeI (YjbR/CyaY-like superfamily)
MIPYAEMEFRDRRSWRTWLETNHASSKGIWLKYYKKGATGKPSVRYPEALEEALCFGWIDSIVRRIDDEAYAQKFTPRAAKSFWSETNLRLVKDLRRRGMMTPAGERAAAAGRRRGPVRVKPGPATAKDEPGIPVFLLAALKRKPPALDHFRNLAPGYRRLYLKWILDGKREETRLKRAAEAAERLRLNLKLGLK